MEIASNTVVLNKPGINNIEHQKDPKLWKVVQDFESILTYQMLRTMRETIPKAGLTEESPGKDYFMSIFDEEVARSITRRQNGSLAETLYRQLAGEKILPRSNFEAVQSINTEKKVYQQHNIFDRVNRFSPIIRKASQQFNVDQHLISAVIAQESGANPSVISSKGATGLMQLMPATAQEMGVRDITNPAENIRGGTKYLSRMLQRFKGDTELALAAYNAGPSAVKKYNGIPPYKETQNYVKRVLNYYQAFKNR